MHIMEIFEPGQTPLPHADEAAVGIDLGTTHSVVAVAHGTQAGAAQVEVLHLSGSCGGTLVPSVVAYGRDGDVLVGQSATHADDAGAVVLRSIKRLMGRGLADLHGLEGAAMYPVDADAPTGAGIVALRTPTGRVTAVEVSAAILRHLREAAEEKLGKAVTKAVITVPAYFDDAARLATRDAARLAGLDVLRLVNEPTAAALAYGLDAQAEGVFAIYDLGGGTFDISLLRLERGVFQVLATAGDLALGGDDFDHALLRHVLGAEALAAMDAPTLQVAQQAARRAKEQLTIADTATLVLGGVEHTITFAAFESIIAPLVARTITIAHSALDDAGLAASEIQGVVLVGGSTRVPAVRAAVAKAFSGVAIHADVNPDEVVAVGAALQASALTYGSETLLLDVTPLSLGLETMGGLVEKLIHRNTPIPTQVAQEFTTYQDGQQGMVIHVLQGEREMVDQCRSLARFELKGIPPLPAGIGRVEVRFALDADGLLSVSAREATTGVEQTIQVKPSYGLSEEEMERMLRESMQFAREDMQQRLLTESRVTAERTVLELESAMRSSASLLRPGEDALLQGQIRRVREAIASTDREAIDFETEELARQCRPFAERRMDKAIMDALKGTTIDDALPHSA